MGIRRSVETVRTPVLKQIEARDGNTYILLFDGEDGATLSMICTAEECDGVRWITAAPDIFMTSGILPRPVAAAVWSFHLARLAASGAE